MWFKQAGCLGINVIFVLGINWISSTCTADAAVPNAAGHYAASAEVVFGRRKRKGEGQVMDLKTVCSKESDPQALRLGLPQLCLDFSLNVNASDSCQIELDVGMRFRGDERKYFDLEPINPANLITCAAGEQLVSNAPIFQQICGSGVQVLIFVCKRQRAKTHLLTLSLSFYSLLSLFSIYLSISFYLDLFLFALSMYLIRSISLFSSLSVSLSLSLAHTK